MKTHSCESRDFSKTFHFVLFPLTIGINSQNTATARAETKHKRKAKKLSFFAAKEVLWLTCRWDAFSPSRSMQWWCQFTLLTVAMSIDAVASSMMRMLLLRTKARARQKSCRCPTLKFSPPSVTIASVIKSVTSNVSPLKCCTFVQSRPGDFEWAPWKLCLCTIPGSSKIPVKASKRSLDWTLDWMVWYQEKRAQLLGKEAIYC